MIDWACEILALKNNRDLLCYLIVAMIKKQSSVNRLKMW